MYFTKEQSTYIKLIAAFTMLLDHIGVLILPEYPILRIIGRISFPLFAFQVSISCINTRDQIKYISRLLIFASIMHLSFSLVTLIVPNLYSNYTPLNIFFTLGLGSLAVVSFMRRQYAVTSICFFIPLIVQLAFNVSFDYGTYGIILIFCFYLFRHNFVYLASALITLEVIYYFSNIFTIQIYSLLALLFLIKPISINLKIPNTFFYLFYPLHLVFLSLLAYLI